MKISFGSFFGSKRGKTYLKYSRPHSQKPLITFAITWMPKARCVDWDSAMKCAEHNLRSICNQKNKDYEILIAYCEEDTDVLPNFLKNYPVKLLPFPFLEDTLNDSGSAKLEDKHNKNRNMLNISKGRYHYIVDWDDIVSNNLTKYISKNPSEHGYYMSRGYLYFQKSQRIKRIKNFNSRCGSSNIVAFTDKEKSDPSLMEFNHSRMAAERELLGKPLNKIDQRLVMYSKHHWSVSTTVRKQTRRDIDTIAIGFRIRREFSFV